MDVDSGCLICHEELLSQEACALSCGHVYHTLCFHQWHATGKANCPQCKKNANVDQLRVCEFEVAVVTAERSEKMQALQALPASELSHRRLDADNRQTGLRGQANAIAAKIEEVGNAASEVRRQRKEMLKEARERKEEIIQHNLGRELQAGKCVEVKNSMDKNQQKYQMKLPVPQAKEGDVDVESERRKLKSSRTIDRAKHLHESLVFLRRQELKIRSCVREKEEGLAGLASSAAKARQKNASLRGKLADRRDAAAEAKLLGPESKKDDGRNKEEDGDAASTNLAFAIENVSRTSFSSTSFDRTSAGSALSDDESVLTTGSSQGGAKFGVILGRQRLAGVGTEGRRSQSVDAVTPDVSASPGSAASVAGGSVPRQLNRPSAPSVAMAAPTTGGIAGGSKFGGLFAMKRSVPASAGPSAANASRNSLRMRLSERGA